MINHIAARQPEVLRNNVASHRYGWRHGLLCLLFAAQAMLASAFDSPALDYETVRTRGMGGCSVALSDDQQALYSNPAGLFQNRENLFAVADVAAEVNQDLRRVENKTSGLSDKDTPESRASNNALLRDVMGQRARLQASNLAYYLGEKGFGTGFLYQSTTSIGVNSPANPRIKAQGTVDSVLSGSISRPIPGVKNLFQDKALGWWGGSLKFVSRRYIDREYDPRDFAGLSESDLRDAQYKGTGMDFDAGTFWVLDNSFQQTIGVVIHNVIETELDPLVGRLPRQFCLGTAIKPLNGGPERKQKLVLAADLWDFTGGGAMLNHLRLGVEGKPRPWLTLRGGVRAGYLTAGCTMRFRVARFDFATYSEELGNRPGDREDRRYSGELSLDF